MVALIFGTRGLILGANAEYGGWIGMFHTKVTAVISLRCMTFGSSLYGFLAMMPRLFFEVVFLLLNGSAHFWDERFNFRGECRIWGMDRDVYL